LRRDHELVTREPWYEGEDEAFIESWREELDSSDDDTNYRDHPTVGSDALNSVLCVDSKGASLYRFAPLGTQSSSRLREERDMSNAWLFTVPDTVIIEPLHSLDPRREYTELVEPGVEKRVWGKTRSMRPEDKARGGRLSCYRELIPTAPLTSAELSTVVPPLRDPPMPDIPTNSGWRQASNADIRAGTNPDELVWEDKPPPWKSRKASPTAKNRSTARLAPRRGSGGWSYRAPHGIGGEASSESLSAAAILRGETSLEGVDRER
jgi:hypothetical protein